MCRVHDTRTPYDAQVHIIRVHILVYFTVLQL